MKQIKRKAQFVSSSVLPTHRLVPDGLDPAVEQRGLVQDRRHVPRLAEVERGHGMRGRSISGEAIV